MGIHQPDDPGRGPAPRRRCAHPGGDRRVSWRWVAGPRTSPSAPVLDAYGCYATGVTSEPRVDQPVHQDPGRPSRAPRRSPRAWREGISINVTLIFSLSRYGAVMDAFLDGMERAHMRRPSCAA